MTAKEYLSQAYHLNRRIDAKLAQITVLNNLAVKCTASLSGMPSNPSKPTSSMADTVAKIVDLQEELNADIDRLIELQKEIAAAINNMDSIDQRIILERRYLCYESFEKIAAATGYTVRNVFILHRKALKKVRIPE
ncbi:MAG: sigma-70 family RNA polymerase sigma factor [Ruminococcus sp.]|nr:sigma-70 family RNA polymerase sigma factor [Ruminococcus sp.]